MTSSDPRISVIVPVLNGAEVLGACLDALAAQGDPPPFEVLVVDNGSTDSTAEMAHSHPIGPRVCHEIRRGPYAARNTGIDHATGAVLAFTDADCVPAADWLRSGLAEIEAGADLVAGEVIQMGSGRPSVWERYDRATYLNQRRFVAEQGFGATANLFVRADVVGSVGPFRPELVASGDLEFGNRAVGSGYRLVHGATTRVDHRPRTSMRDTWALHRKLGSGFSELARHAGRGPAWRDPGLRIPFETTVAEINADGPRLRRRVILPVHALVLTARWVGRLTGRG